jgi:hypothetical protein
MVNHHLFVLYRTSCSDSYKKIETKKILLQVSIYIIMFC